MLGTGSRRTRLQRFDDKTLDLFTDVHFGLSEFRCTDAADIALRR